jgi:phosphopantetheine--protein transferase-like protein
MLGNDVVDFSVDEKKYNNQRFINRILTSTEQKYLFLSTNKNAFLWTLWAAKEAAYKAYQKQNLSSLFSPVKYEISENTLLKLVEAKFSETVKGVLKYTNDRSVLIPIEIRWPDKTCVHCISSFDVSNQQGENLYSKLMKLDCEEDYTSQSLLVRGLAQTLLDDLNIQAEIIRPEIKVKDYKKPGPPRLISDNQLLDHEISLSHDGKWLAVAILVNS